MELSQTDKFAEVMQGLCDNIKEMVTDMYEMGHKRIHPKLIDVIKAYLKDKPKTSILEAFIEGSVSFWTQIRRREEDFFINNVTKVLGSLPYPKEIKEFSRLFLLKDEDGNRVLLDEDIEIIWEHFESMICICIVYIHMGRHPGIKKPDSKGVATPVYTKSFFPNIKLAEQARLWNIKLEW